jgi:hypothetical protein
VHVAPRLQALVDVGHQIGLRLAEHDLKVGGLEADVFEAVDDVGRRRDAVPLAEHRLHPLALAVLEEDAHLAAQDEEDLLHLVGVGGVALARRHEHDAQREVLGGDHARVLLARGARADEAMLGATVSLHARVGERVPVALTVHEARDLSM